MDGGKTGKSGYCSSRYLMIASESAMMTGLEGSFVASTRAGMV